ncbi:MAG: GNAT family N-acetyltransferase [Actinomycetota bacterium]|nr:GNAT family N-acetyltransferase [Actinomycetota bacterium]
MPGAEIRLLRPSDVTEDFTSGEPSVDEYLLRFAHSMQAAGGPVTYVAVEEQRVLGYFSLVSGSIEREDAPERLTKGMGNYPVPVQVLARMGVHQAVQGQGLGSELLLAALREAARAAEIVGVRAVVTHPLNYSLTAFYSRYGFERFNDPNHELSMYMLMKKVRGTLRDCGMLPPPST